MLAQRTLKSLTRAVGVGVHGGQRVELTLRPAPADTGIVFRRVDLPAPVDIKVDAFAITDTRWRRRCRPTATRARRRCSTIEHLLSACAGLGLDNLRRRHHGRGGADPRRLGGVSFVFLLQSAGIELQDAPKRFLRVLQAGRGARRRGRAR